MRSWLRNLRVSRLQLALVAALSLGATALVIATANGHTDAQLAALAALHQQPGVTATTAAADTAAAGSANAAAGGAAAGPEATPPPAAPPPPAPTTTTTAAPAAAGAGATGPSATDTTGTTDQTTTTPSSTPKAKKASKVKHVFVIALSTPSFEDAFGHDSTATYLNGTLRRKGTLLGGYETLDSAELPDYLAMVGGQAPNADTRGDCATYAEFPSSAHPNKAGLVSGDGCIYPNTVTTIGDQVTASAHTWRAYVDDMGSTPCAHPDSGAATNTPITGAGSQYDVLHNPFIYFHSLLDLGDCSSDDLTLQKLGSALAAPAKKAPSYVFVAPGACADSSQTSCPDGTPAGLAGEDAFLKSWVPKILRSSAYRTDGALLIVFAHSAPSTGADTATGPVPAGALVLSRYAKANKTISTVYNPYSVLRSTEDLLGLKALGKAATAKSFVKTALPGA
jgi:phosphatidylinositol-3-phosphatase